MTDRLLSIVGGFAGGCVVFLLVFRSELVRRLYHAPGESSEPYDPPFSLDDHAEAVTHYLHSRRLPLDVLARRRA